MALLSFLGPPIQKLSLPLEGSHSKAEKGTLSQSQRSTSAPLPNRQSPLEPAGAEEEDCLACLAASSWHLVHD